MFGAALMMQLERPTSTAEGGGIPVKFHEHIRDELPRAPHVKAVWARDRLGGNHNGKYPVNGRRIKPRTDADAN